MPVVAAPDPDEFFDHVLDVSEPGLPRIGPARRRQAEWYAAAAHLQRESADGPLDAAVQQACRQGLVLRRADLAQLGVPIPLARRLVRRGDWSAPRRGVLSPLPRDPSTSADHPSEVALSPHCAAPQLLAAAAALQRPGSLASHECAGLMHGLPVLELPARPTLTVVEAGHVAGRADVLVRGVGFKRREIAAWFGTPVTDVARTIVDIARTSGVAAGLVAADAALSDRLVDRAKIIRARDDARFRPGVRNVDRIIDLMDGRIESPLESLTRLCLADGGLPLPEPQQWIVTHRGRYRVDGLYLGRRVVVECDGELKYRGTDAHPFIEEKRRHEALVRAGFVVVRITWADIRDEPHDVVFRVRAALSGSATPGSV